VRRPPTAQYRDAAVAGRLEESAVPMTPIASKVSFLGNKSSVELSFSMSFRKNGVLLLLLEAKVAPRFYKLKSDIIQFTENLRKKLIHPKCHSHPADKRQIRFSPFSSVLVSIPMAKFSGNHPVFWKFFKDRG
jgi:hypothetical protein